MDVDCVFINEYHIGKISVGVGKVGFVRQDLKRGAVEVVGAHTGIAAQHLTADDRPHLEDNQRTDSITKMQVSTANKGFICAGYLELRAKLNAVEEKVNAVEAKGGGGGESCGAPNCSRHGVPLEEYCCELYF